MSAVRGCSALLKDRSRSNLHGSTESHAVTFHVDHQTCTILAQQKIEQHFDHYISAKESLGVCQTAWNSELCYLSRPAPAREHC